MAASNVIAEFETIIEVFVMEEHPNIGISFDEPPKTDALFPSMHRVTLYQPIGLLSSHASLD